MVDSWPDLDHGKRLHLAFSIPTWGRYSQAGKYWESRAAPNPALCMTTGGPRVTTPRKEAQGSDMTMMICEHLFGSSQTLNRHDD